MTIICVSVNFMHCIDRPGYATRKFFYGRASPSASPNWRLFVPTWKYSSPPPSGILLLSLHLTHNNTQNKMSRCRPTPAALPHISMATSAMASNHGATISHESVAGAWRWVCSRHGWFPWLGCPMKMHQKIERGAGPRPKVAAV